MGMPQQIVPVDDIDSYIVDVPLQVLDAVLVHEDAADSYTVECSLTSARSVELMDRLHASAISLAASLESRLVASRSHSGWNITVQCWSPDDAMRLIRELDAELLKGDSTWRRRFAGLRERVILVGNLGRTVCNVASILTRAFEAANDEQADAGAPAPFVRAIAAAGKELLPPGTSLGRFFAGLLVILNTPSALTHAWEQSVTLLLWFCKMLT